MCSLEVALICSHQVVTRNGKTSRTCGLGTCNMNVPHSSARCCNKDLCNASTKVALGALLPTVSVISALIAMYHA